jgi:RNA polymerase III subunit RPC82
VPTIWPCFRCMGPFPDHTAPSSHHPSKEFNRRFRHSMCIDMVRQKVDAVAGDVVTAMLQLSRPHETRLQEDRSAPLAESAISAAVADIIESGRSIQLSPDKVSGASCFAPGCGDKLLSAVTTQRCSDGWQQTRQRCALTPLPAPRSSHPPAPARHLRGRRPRGRLVLCEHEAHH